MRVQEVRVAEQSKSLTKEQNKSVNVKYTKKPVTNARLPLSTAL